MLSYLANFFILLGFGTEYITVSFFDTEDTTSSSLKYPDMQVILLASSFMYFSVGNVLEYTKGCDQFLWFVLVLIGTFKVLVIFFYL